MNIQKQTAIIPFVSPEKWKGCTFLSRCKKKDNYSIKCLPPRKLIIDYLRYCFDHGCGQMPRVNLAAFFCWLAQTLWTEVFIIDRYRPLRRRFDVQIESSITWHKYIAWFSNQNLLFGKYKIQSTLLIQYNRPYNCVLTLYFVHTGKRIWSHSSTSSTIASEK